MYCISCKCRVVFDTRVSFRAIRPNEKCSVLNNAFFFVVAKPDESPARILKSLMHHVSFREKCFFVCSWKHAFLLFKKRMVLLF